MHNFTSIKNATGKVKNQNTASSDENNKNEYNEKFIDVSHFTELFKFECCICDILFLLNNQLHRHLQIRCFYEKIILIKFLSDFKTQLMSSIMNHFIFVKFIITNQSNSKEYKFQD